MTNEMPNTENYIGLSRLVLQYADDFSRIVEKLKQGNLSETDWAPIEELVDVDNFQRVGIFLTDQVEVSTWQQYKAIINQYGALTSWEGTLRRITEVHGLVFLELEERNTTGGITDVANTVTIYQFNKADKIIKLDVYVAPLGKRIMPT
ncbi:hypothetical protein ACFLTQ_00675 [Chloroflexota bacterium]